MTSSNARPDAPPRPVLVWDAPIRLFHWGLVICIALSWWTAETRKMDWHRYSGYAILGLLVFRILWGVVGSSTARFSGFVRSPAATWRYLRGNGASGPGHNPLGAWSVLAMLLLLMTQVALGLFAVDVDGFESGPLSDRVSFEAGRTAAAWHDLVFNGLLVLIGLHLAAIAFYAVVRRRNLLGPMVTGRRAAGVEPDEVTRGSPLALLVCVAVSVLATWFVAKGLRL